MHKKDCESPKHVRETRSTSNGEVDLWDYGPQPGQLIQTPRGQARVLNRRYGVATVQLVEDGDVAFVFIGRRLQND